MTQLKIGKLSKETLLKRIHTNGQLAHEKMLTITTLWENVN
jgi:hypothetical protein